MWAEIILRYARFVFVHRKCCRSSKIYLTFLFIDCAHCAYIWSRGLHWTPLLLTHQKHSAAVATLIKLHIGWRQIFTAGSFSHSLMLWLMKKLLVKVEVNNHSKVCEQIWLFFIIHGLTDKSFVVRQFFFACWFLQRRLHNGSFRKDSWHWGRGKKKQ